MWTHLENREGALGCVELGEKIKPIDELSGQNCTVGKETKILIGN